MTDGTYENPDYSLLGDEDVRRYQETDGEVGYWWNYDVYQERTERTIPVVVLSPR